MPEKFDTSGDTPRVVVDVPALIHKNSAWWSAQASFKKLDLERFKKSGLMKGELQIFKQYFTVFHFPVCSF